MIGSASSPGSGPDAAAFVALRRPSGPADEQFASVASSVTDVGLDLAAVRLVLATPDGVAGLIPGNGVLCFVAVTTKMGAISQRVATGWAGTHDGFGFRAKTGGYVLLQGIVPDDTIGVQFTDSNGRATSVALSADNGYSEVLDAVPVKVTYLDAEGQAREHDL